MMIIEVKTDNGIVKYEEVAEDFDSFAVKGIDKGIDGGFVYTNRLTNEPSCMIVKKDQVIARYNDWDDTYDMYKGIRVDCNEKDDGKITVSAHNVPEELADEFTKEEYLNYARGDEYPPFEDVSYHKTVEPDDPDLKMEFTESHHKDLEIRRYGDASGLDGAERDRLHADYLAEKITHYDGLESDPIYRLFIGSYGFAYTDDNGLVDLDTVFEKIIPAAYQKLVDEGSRYGAGNFVKELEQCAFRNKHFRGFNNDDEYTVITDGKRAELSEEYIYYLYLQRALKIKKYHSEGVAPYAQMKLSSVWYWFEEDYEKYSNDHNPVSFNGVTLCDDLGEYVKSIGSEMEYYIPFDTLTEK